MCETKAVLASISLILRVAASFCIYQAHKEKKVGHHSGVKGQSPCKNEYQKYFLNGRECFYLIDENIVGCICTWLYGRKRCENYIWWNQVIVSNKERRIFFIKINYVVKRSFENLRRRKKKFSSNSDTLLTF